MQRRIQLPLAGLFLVLLAAGAAVALAAGAAPPAPVPQPSPEMPGMQSMPGMPRALPAPLKAADVPAGRRAESTARMAALLADLAAKADPEKNVILNRRRAELARVRFERAQDPAERRRQRFGLAYELLLAGATGEAIEHLLALRREYQGLEGPEHAASLAKVAELLGMAYLRLGEQENCVARHNIDSCLLPILGSGVHALPRGARLAFQEYSALLDRQPGNLETRWMLNLAAMLLGEHPQGVPEQWRIPLAAFDSEHDVKRFRDVAPGLGLGVAGHAGGAILEDFDGDGYLDAMVSSWDLPDQLRYFRNNADGTFAERTVEAGLAGEAGGLNILQTDYDNDGHPDVLVLRGAWLGFTGQGNHPDSLLRNNGDGTFADVTEEAGLLSFHPTGAAAWGDFDNDGWVDLYVGNESNGGASHPCQLFRNNGDGTFTDVAAEAGVANVGFVKGVAWGDYDNDGRPDLYLSRFGQQNVLYHNDGPASAPAGETSGGKSPAWKFTDVTEQAGVAEPLRSFTTWFWDYDNDGWLDLLVAPFLGFAGNNLATVAGDSLGLPVKGETPRLYRNRGDGTFEDATKAAHLDRPLLTMGGNFGDLDNDGFLDAYFGTGEPALATLVPNRMFRNDAGRAFQDVTTSGGFGHLQKGHGIAFGDVDNDGDQDVYAVMGGAYEGDVYWKALFENPGHGNRWITLRLEGVASNRAAIGARVRVIVDAPEGERSVHATVGTGGSFGSSSLQQEIGLGRARAVRAIEVTWPRTGKTQTFRGVGLDQVLRIREDAPVPVRVELKRLDLGAAAAHGAHSGH